MCSAFKLFLSELCDEFDAGDCVLSRSKGFKPHHWPGDPFYSSMILLDDIVHIFILSRDDFGFE